MRSVRETYDLPPEPPLPARMWVLMLAVVGIALGLWLIFPSSWATVAALAVVILGVVFFGVWRVMGARQFSRPPQRNPTQPPSTRGS